MSSLALNTLGRDWDFTHTQCMEKFISTELEYCKGLEFDKAIEVSGQLLKYEKIGNHLYEIVVESFSPNSSSNRIKSILKDLVSQVYIYDFVIEMRNVISGMDNCGPDIMSALMKFAGLILKAYNVGRLEGVHSSTQEVLISQIVDPYDLSLIFLLEINNRPKLLSKIDNSSKYKLYDTDKKRFKKYLYNKDVYKLGEQVKELDDERLIELANNSGTSSPYSYINNFYNEVDSYFFPDYDVLQCMHWEREETTKPKSTVLLFFNYLIKNLIEPDILRNRDFYIRDKGVRIVFDKPLDTVVSIELREVHLDNQFDEHYINFFYTLKTGETRMLTLSMKDIINVESLLLYEMDAQVTMMVLAWLGLLNTLKIKPGDIKRTQSNVDMKSCVEVSKGLNEWIAFIVNGMKSGNYYYETPTQWNYNNINSVNKGKERVASSQRLIKVGRYTRRLPAGHNPSQEALALAKKYYIELKPGYTIVDEFERLQSYK